MDLVTYSPQKPWEMIRQRALVTPLQNGQAWPILAEEIAEIGWQEKTLQRNDSLFLFQLPGNGFDHLLGQHAGTLGGEVDVGGPLNLLQFSDRKTVQVVDGNAMFFHHT